MEIAVKLGVGYTTVRYTRFVFMLNFLGPKTPSPRVKVPDRMRPANRATSLSSSLIQFSDKVGHLLSSEGSSISSLSGQLVASCWTLVWGIPVDVAGQLQAK